MWLLSTAAGKTQAQSHTMVARVDVLHAGRVSATLTPTGGQVSADATRPVLRNLSCTLVDPTGSLSTGDLGDLLDPYSAELAAYRGLVLYRGTPQETIEWAPYGVYQLTSRGVPGDGSITVTGQDRAIMYQGGMTGALAIPGATPVETAVQRLLSTRNPGLTMLSWKTGFTCGPLLYSPDVDVWDEALTLAKSVGGWLHHDRTGRLVFGPTLPTSSRPVRRWAEGDGLLIDVDRQEDSDTIHNVVVVSSEKTATGGVIQAVAEDANPSSPTYSRGRYGRRPTTIVNPHISTITQAQQVASTELIRELGRSETVKATTVVDLAVDPLDVVTINRPRSGLAERGLVIDSLAVPLTADGAMTMQMRSSIIAQNGRVLDTADEVTVS